MSDLILDACYFDAVIRLRREGFDPMLAKAAAKGFRRHFAEALAGRVDRDRWVLLIPYANGCIQTSVCSKEEFEERSAYLVKENALHVGVEIGRALADAEAQLRAEGDEGQLQ